MEHSGNSAPVQETAESNVSGFAKFKAGVSKTNSIINLIGVWLFRLRKFVLATPVVYYALKLAAYNSEHLPEVVGIDLQSTGEFAQTISRGLAVMGPLGLTLACLLLMFCSRKTMYPWAISIFTLALPLLILLSNVYPT